MLALFRRVSLEIVRDKPSLALLLLAPLVMSGLITFIIREADTPAVEAVAVNAAGMPGMVVAARLAESIEAAGGTFTLVSDEAVARTAVRQGDASVAVLLPQDLASGGRADADAGDERARPHGREHADRAVAAGAAGGGLGHDRHEGPHDHP